MLGNCRGINCGQILSLNKTCSNSSGAAAHKSHSYPFPPTPAQTRPPIHGNFPRFGNRSVVRMNMSVTSHWWCAELQEGVSQGGSWGVKKETIILANDRSWWDVLATTSIHIVSLSFTESLGSPSVEHFSWTFWETGVSVCLYFVELMDWGWRLRGIRRLMMLQTILVRLYGFAAISYIVSALVLQTKSSE